MATPDYFGRGALAAAQVLAGLDEGRIKSVLSSVRVGIRMSEDAAASPEGRALVDLLVRLVARFYPTLSLTIEGPGTLAAELQELAARINPLIEMVEEPTIEVVIGHADTHGQALRRVFVGSDGWRATVSSSTPQGVGKSENPFGAGVAAAIAAANVFRAAFLEDPQLDEDATFSLIDSPAAEHSSELQLTDVGEIVLVGCGAIGNAAAWALSRARVTGTLHLVDHESIDLGNLQRYVLAERADEGRVKVDVLKGAFSSALKPTSHQKTFAEFVSANGYSWPRMLLALDSARDRRMAQASLPHWVANAWTQPGDLGMSVHSFQHGSCVSCLYLPQGQVESDDLVIAKALGVPDRQMEVRLLLFQGGGVTRDLLEAIAQATTLPLDRLLPYENQPLRRLYSEGFCGGAVVPIGQAGQPRQDVHVPLAHQSALAGVLLGAAVVLNVQEGHPSATNVTRVNVLGRLPSVPRQSAAKDSRGICVCQDADYKAAYAAKYYSGAAAMRG